MTHKRYNDDPLLGHGSQFRTSVLDTSITLTTYVSRYVTFDRKIYRKRKRKKKKTPNLISIASLNDSRCWWSRTYFEFFRDPRITFPSDRDRRCTIISCRRHASHANTRRNFSKNHFPRAPFRIICTRYFNLFCTRDDCCWNFAPDTPHETFLSADLQIW